MLARQQFSTDGTTNGAAPVRLATASDADALNRLPEAMLTAIDEQEPAAPDAKATERRRQSQKQLAQLNAVGQMLNGLATADPAFQAAMASAGLLEEYLAACAARYAAAEQGIAARHQAMVEALAATEALDAAELRARAVYSAFRQVARTVVSSHSGRTALKLDEEIPTQRSLFVRTAEAVLTAAQGEPYAMLLGATTFGPARISEAMATLDALETAQAAQAAAQHRAEAATLARDMAMRTLMMAARQIRVEVKILLRCNPHLQAPVGF